MSLKYFFLLFFVIYITIIVMWYFFPTGIVNLKYTVEGKEIRDLSPTKGNLYIVDHRENQIVDILIMSNESRKIKKTNYLVSGGSSEVK